MGICDGVPSTAALVLLNDHPLKKCFDLLTPSQGSSVCVRSKCLLACYGAPLISLVSMMQFPQFPCMFIPIWTNRISH